MQGFFPTLADDGRVLYMRWEWTDVNGAREVLVAQDGKISCGRPIPVRVRNLPARSSVRPDESLKTGTITIADVYRGESMKGVARGTVKSMRVVSFSYRPAGVGRSVVRGPGGFAMNATPPVGVGEIRVRQGNLCTSEPDLIPPAVKILSLGGQFSDAPISKMR